MQSAYQIILFDLPHKSHLKPHPLGKVLFLPLCFLHVSSWPSVHIIRREASQSRFSFPSFLLSAASPYSRLSPATVIGRSILDSLSCYYFFQGQSGNALEHCRDGKEGYKLRTQVKAYPSLVADCMRKEAPWSREPTSTEHSRHYAGCFLEWSTKFLQAAHNTGIASSLLQIRN